MELQKIFLRSYSDQLRKHIELSNYRLDEFPYDKTRTKSLANIYKPVGLLDKMNPDDDFKSALELYKAYNTLTPLIASLPDLWIYLAHVDLFSYMQKRRSDVMREDVEKDYIIRHWFKNDVSIFRMTLPGFWWSVHLSVDMERDNPYELTEILFKNQELRTSSFGELPLIRHKEAMKGVLEFLKEHPELLEDGFNMRARFIQKLFNNIGGYKKLVYMDKYFFKTELEKRLQIISQKFSREEIQNNKALYI